MRETVKEWQDEWIETNGKTDETEVLIQDSRLDKYHPYVYEGSFTGIPEEYLDKKVIESGQVIDSTDPEWIGAYALVI